MKNLILIIILSSLSMSLWAQKKSTADVPSSYSNRPTAKKDKNSAYKENLNDDDFSDAKSNYKTKLFEGNYDIEHRSKLSLSYATNFDLRNISEISGFELIYGNEGDYSWFQFLIAQSSVLFSSVTEVNASAPAVSVEMENQKETLFSVGPGISYKSTMIQNLLNTTSLTESTTVYLLYYMFNESFQNYKYNGLGLRTDFTLNFPLTNVTEFGLKFSYHLAPLKRSEEFDNESSSARSQLISYLGMSFEFSYFF